MTTHIHTRTLADLSPVTRARLAGWLELAERGWRLFPIRPGRKAPPVFTGWARHATTDPARLIGYFTRNPRHNAGIACRPSGLLVIDCDLPKRSGEHGDGTANLSQLAAARGHALPDTYAVATPSGGRHFYFRTPAGTGGLPELGNTARTLAPLLDSRGGGTGDGGYVLAAGSWLAPTPALGNRPGHAGGTYELIDDTDPVELPTWLHQALTECRSTGGTGPAQRPCQPLSAPGRYLSAVLRDELDRVHNAGRGQHNAAVFTAARALGQLAAGGALDPGQAEALITDAAAQIAAGPCDCTTAGLAATIRSGLAYGTRRPRHLPTVEHTHRKASA